MKSKSIAWLVLLSSAACCVNAHYSCGEQWDRQACDPKYGGCSTCGKRIEWLQKNKGKDSHNARKIVAKEFPEECGKCAPEGYRPPPPPPAPRPTPPPTPRTRPPMPPMPPMQTRPPTPVPPTPRTRPPMPPMPPMQTRPPTPGTPGVPPMWTRPPTPGTPGVPPTTPGVPPTPGMPTPTPTPTMPGTPPAGCFGTWMGGPESECLSTIPESQRGPFGSWESGWTHMVAPSDGGVFDGVFHIVAEGAAGEAWTGTGGEIQTPGITRESLLMWPAAGGCSTEQSRPTGSVDIEVSGDGVGVSVNAGSGLMLHKARLWVGSTPLPQPWAGRYTADPANFPYEATGEVVGEGADTFTVPNPDPTQPLYFAVYAEVCPYTSTDSTAPF